MEFDKKIGKARIKSTQTQVRISYKGDTIKLNKRKLKKFFVKAAAFCICIHFFGHALDNMVYGTAEKVEYLFDVASVRVEESKETEELLLSYNLNTEPLENGDWDNDYSCIKELSEDDLYGFVQYCGSTETEKVLQALGYSSWYNYLATEGYYDQTGRPSKQVWENHAEYELVTEMKEALENGRSY